MTRFLALLISVSLFFITPVSLAQENTEASESIDVNEVINTESALEPVVEKQSVQVGKHAMVNMDAGSMILSLIMVLVIIFVSAIVLKRFNLLQQSSNQLKVIGSLSLGAKERVVVVQVGEQQLVLGVCPQQVTLLKDLEHPLDIQLGKSVPLAGNVLAFLQKSTIKTTSASDIVADKKPSKDSTSSH